MLHVSAGSGAGLFQRFLPIDTGPTQVFASSWIYVLTGQVGIGTGNDGNTHLDILTSGTGYWEFLQAPNGISPANEFIIYSFNGPAEFYAENAGVTVPEPGILILLGISMASVVGLRRRWKD